MLPANSEFQLEYLFDKEKFVRETIAQVVKDFAYELPPLIPLMDKHGIVVLDDLVHQLEGMLQKMNHTTLLQSIYQIDLNEKDFATALHQDDFNKIAHLIIERAAQKVYLRWSYK